MTLGFSQISCGSLTNCFMKVATHFDRISTNLKNEKQKIIRVYRAAAKPIIFLNFFVKLISRKFHESLTNLKYENKQL